MPFDNSALFRSFMGRETAEPPLLNPGDEGVFIFPQSMRFEGLLEYDGDLIINHQHLGDITARRVVVGPEGQIDGLIAAEVIEVFGTINGAIYANDVRVRTGSRVDGEIHFTTLKLEPDAWFEGKTRRYQSGFAAAPQIVARASKQPAENGVIDARDLALVHPSGPSQHPSR